MSLKQLKEQFVSDLPGGSISEIYAVTSVSLAAFLAHTLYSRFIVPNSSLAASPLLQFVVEFSLDVVVQLQAITILSGSVYKIHTMLFFVSVAAIVLKILNANAQAATQSKTRSKSAQSGSQNGSETGSSSTSKTASTDLLAQVPYITAYRAQMIVITNLAILAVDFHVFPRRFAKVETWGTSLMDLGVGSFVFSMGLASSRATIKEAIAKQRSANSMARLLWHAASKAFPVLFLGLVRLVSVKSLEYQEHVTEYGVHWNFFMTLGLLPVVLAILDPVLARVPRFAVALAIAVLYEWALNSAGGTEFVLDESNRAQSWLTMNKEGVFSFCGYLSIFIFGQSFGSFVLTSRKTANNLLFAPSSARPNRYLTVSSTKGLVIASIVSLVLFSVAKESFLTGNISRRLANLPYVLWVVSYNSMFLLGYNIIEKYVGPLHSSVFEAVNKNGLAIFLVANVTTGLVNMTINTLEASNGAAYTILLAYSLTWVALAMVLHRYKIYIKL